MQGILKNIIVIVGLVGILGLGYYLFVIQRDSTLPSNSVGVSDADIQSQNFLRKLNLIQSIDFSNSIFDDAKFNSLVEFSTPIEAVSVGRDNPFAK